MGVPRKYISRLINDSDFRTICTAAGSLLINIAYAEVYSLYGDSTEIHRLDDISSIKDNNISVEIKPLSVTEIVVHKKTGNVKIPVIAACGAALVCAAAAVFGFERRKGKH